jgi:hypothetical protein
MTDYPLQYLIFINMKYVLNRWKSYFQSLLTDDTQKEIEQKYEDLGMEDDGEIRWKQLWGK